MMSYLQQWMRRGVVGLMMSVARLMQAQCMDICEAMIRWQLIQLTLARIEIGEPFDELTIWTIDKV